MAIVLSRLREKALARESVVEDGVKIGLFSVRDYRDEETKIKTEIAEIKTALAAVGKEVIYKEGQINPLFL